MVAPYGKLSFSCVDFSADATVYVGGLDEKVSEALIWELFLQAGPVGKEYTL